MALTEVSNIFFCTRLQKPRVLKETGEQQQQQRIINLANANSNSYYFRNLQKVMSKFDLITSLEVLNSMREWNSEYYTIVLIQVEPFLCHLDANGWLVRAADFTSICLLTSSSGSRSSWLRNKSRTGPFLNGFGWRLVIKSVTTPRGDIGEEPSWVCKELHTGWLTYLCCVRTALHLTVFLRSLLSGQLSAFYWEIAGRMRLFSLLIFFCTRKLV